MIHSMLGSSIVRRASTATAPGRTTLSGMSRCSRSVRVTTTRIQQKSVAAAACEREAEDEPACTTEQRGAEQHERESRRPRHAPEQRVVERRVRRDPVGERSDEHAEEQPDDPRGEIHAADFRDGQPDPSH